jgi:hypothetical protein
MSTAPVSARAGARAQAGAGPHRHARALRGLSGLRAPALFVRKHDRVLDALVQEDVGRVPNPVTDLRAPRSERPRPLSFASCGW